MFQWMKVPDQVSQQLEGYTPLHILGATRARLCEIYSLSTWCYCFLGYTAIIFSDLTTRDQLAYAHLIIREALLWWARLDYDTAFRLQAAADPYLCWNTLLHAAPLQASTILGHNLGQGAIFCTLCWEVYHTRAQCALLYLQPPTMRAPTSSYPTGSRCRSDKICTGKSAFSQVAAHTGVCVLCSSLHIRWKIVQRLLRA